MRHSLTKHLSSSNAVWLTSPTKHCQLNMASPAGRSPMTNEPKRLTRASKSSIMHIQEDMPHMSDVSQSATRKDTLAHYMRTACNGSPNIRLDCGTAWQQHSVPETYHFDYVLSALGVSVGFSLCPYLSFFSPVHSLFATLFQSTDCGYVLPDRWHARKGFRKESGWS